MLYINHSGKYIDNNFNMKIPLLCKYNPFASPVGSHIYFDGCIDGVICNLSTLHTLSSGFHQDTLIGFIIGIKLINLR